jgi:hypothetical protein
MPTNENPVKHIEELTQTDREKEANYCQEHWYILASLLCGGKTVLDVGTGTGYGVPILKSAGALSVSGIDPLPLLPGTSNIDISHIKDKSFDLVTCFDVIEHVPSDVEFLAELKRIARIGVVLSTPNWLYSKCKNSYHCREYTPIELHNLVQDNYKAWAAGPNRFETGVCEVDLEDDPATELSSLCILLITTEPEDQYIGEDIFGTDYLSAVVAKISRHSKWSGEWNKEIREMFRSAPNPVIGLNMVTGLICDGMEQVEKSIVPASRVDPVMDVMRNGKGTRKELLKVASWIFEELAAVVKEELAK